MGSVDLEIIDLNLMEYSEAFELQQQYVADKINGKVDNDITLILEHPPVFTLGKRGGRENLVVSENFLESRKIPVIQTRRGGNITYHGPGQLVLYTIVDLQQRRIGVADFVHLLEETMIKTASDFGVTAERNCANHGIWVGDSKIGSIGLSVKHGICFHGLALNVNLDLTPFSWINPCGLQGVKMTSLVQENMTNFNDSIMAEVKTTMLVHFKHFIADAHIVTEEDRSR